MIFSTPSQALVGFALLQGAVQGINVYVYNKCDEVLPLSHVSQGAIETVDVPAGGVTVRSIPTGSPSHVFKWGTGAQATLAEFSVTEERVYNDISVIATGPKSGPKNCKSPEECRTLTGGVGFNKPLQITPHTQDGKRCVELTCMQDDCPDAYTFPTDDTKTHVCLALIDFDVTFCPGGSGGATKAPAQAPLPAPTSAPTPGPTPAPAPTPAEEQQEQDQQEQDQQEQEQQEPQPPPPTQSPTGSLGGLNSNPVERVIPPNSQADLGNIRKNNLPSVNSPSTSKTTSLTSKSAPITSGTTQQIGGKSGLDASEQETVQQINTQSESKGGNSTPYIVLGVGGLVGILAAAAIFAVRKKKAALDEMESKTPVSAMPHGALAGFRTPRDNVSVL